MFNRIIRKLGYQKIKTSSQINAGFNFDYSSEIQAGTQIVENHTMLSYPKLGSLYEKVIHCEKYRIEGDFVECGVWKGGAVGMMALANLKHGSYQRKLHLFDSFDDICEPIPEIDGNQALKDIEQLMGSSNNSYSGQVQPITGIYNSKGGHGTIEECRSLLVDKIGYDPNKIQYYKGWFQKTMEIYSLRIEKISILRLDADWYESTKICLEHLYEKVVPGGFVIIDDYGRYDGCRLAVDEYISKHNIQKYLNYSDFRHGECRYIIK